MVVDSSALVAILLQEPDARAFAAAIAGDPRPVLSAASLLETALVIEGRFGEAGREKLDALLERARIVVVDVDARQVEVARAAFRAYGRGRHAARLNFGDLFVYALAKTSGQPLLAKGADFARTDLERVPLPPEAAG